MSVPNLTAEQQQAVGATGKIIVSASAGSGKTFVMIERLVSLILNGADLRSVLAVTFTNKAAAQMREKLRAAILRKISESDDEGRKRLKEQLTALPLADISTIHAFCARLIRTYFYLADVDPSFRIISTDDAEGKTLSLRAMNGVFEEEYAVGDDDFKRLLAVYFRRKKDTQLRTIVLSLYNNVRGLADYRSVLENAGGDRFDEVCAFLREEYVRRARFCAESVEDMGAFFAANSERALRVCADIMEASQKLLNATDFFQMVALAQEMPKIASIPPTTRAVGEERRKLLSLKDVSAFIKEIYRELAKYAPCDEEYARYRDGQERVRSLARLVLKYDEAYARLKREAGVLDYNDLEHFALKILSDAKVKADLREKYRYVFVDEYQDVNPVQERILSFVGGNEVFLVGDAKQSIYGFRGSQSEYFVDKTENFPVSLVLSENFRSAPAVIEAVNRVFTRCMTQETCNIDYANTGVMRGGSRYGEHAGKVCFHLIPAVPQEAVSERGVYSVLQSMKEPPDAQAEAIVRLVEREVGAEWFDADSGLTKRVGYGDIAVLVRKTKTEDARRVVSALSAHNIPVTTTAKVNVCDFWEARLLIDWLSYLDNVEQDIPLAGAMLSRIGGFSDSDLAKIRLRFPSPFTFRASCEQYRTKMEDELSERLREFVKKTEHYRALACVKQAGEMMGLLLADGLGAEIAAKKDGGARLVRVRRLLAEGENCGVNDFLRRLKASSYRVDSAESGGEEAVKVLTMHAVKGLEYPVVILASLDAPFHGADHDDVMWTEKFGFAPRCYDFEKKLYYNTVLRSASAVQQRREELKGELNLFYVAMTRAKYRLHMLFQNAANSFSPAFAKKFSDFVDFSDCAHYFEEEGEAELPPLERKAFVYSPDGETKDRILAEYCRPYPFEKSVSLPVKGSATEFMKHNDIASEKQFSEEKGESATAEEGLAYHAFLQHVRFGGRAVEELARIREEGLVPEERLALLDGEKLERMLAMPSLKALAGKTTYRERSFLVSLPAREILALQTDSEDEIVVQGAIDLLCEEEDGYTILDYKYSSRDQTALANDGNYRAQLSLYKKAVAKITNTEEEKIRARLLNILRLYEIEM